MELINRVAGAAKGTATLTGERASTRASTTVAIGALSRHGEDEIMKLHTMRGAVLLLTGMSLAFPSSSEPGPTKTELNAASASTDWLLPNHDYAGQRFIDLTQVTRENAAQLRPACVYNSRDVPRFAGSPLVYNGVMYLNTASSTVALDATNCTVRWRQDWKSKVNAFQSRGPALKDGKLIRATIRWWPARTRVTI